MQLQHLLKVVDVHIVDRFTLLNTVSHNQKDGKNRKDHKR